MLDEAAGGHRIAVRPPVVFAQMECVVTVPSSLTSQLWRRRGDLPVDGVGRQAFSSSYWILIW